ncbi:uncharacterized protein LOC112468136 [Temnothorax curvispinosus]|uniref:Uncharacterized protein LOC112468136 n=1 Tax=Temnothorax curvispinosus TaxID=300111 RepID=A0A6J1RF85_9HYME|nr:uncharacterized protein LOC112468136 [Temnothorax curvispinosus]
MVQPPYLSSDVADNTYVPELPDLQYNIPLPAMPAMNNEQQRFQLLLEQSRIREPPNHQFATVQQWHELSQEVRRLQSFKIELQQMVLRNIDENKQTSLRRNRRNRH